MNWNVDRRPRRLFSFPLSPIPSVCGTFSWNVSSDAETFGVFCFTLPLKNGEGGRGIQGNDGAANREGGTWRDCVRDLVSFLRDLTCASAEEVPGAFESIFGSEEAARSVDMSPETSSSRSWDVSDSLLSRTGIDETSLGSRILTTRVRSCGAVGSAAASAMGGSREGASNFLLLELALLSTPSSSVTEICL